MQLHLPRRFEELQHNHVWGQVNQVQKCEKWARKKGQIQHQSPLRIQ